MDGVISELGMIDYGVGRLALLNAIHSASDSSPSSFISFF